MYRGESCSSYPALVGMLCVLQTLGTEGINLRSAKCLSKGEACTRAGSITCRPPGERFSEGSFASAAVDSYSVSREEQPGRTLLPLLEAVMLKSQSGICV